MQLGAIESTANKHAALKEAVDIIASIVQHDHITIERFARNGVPSFVAYQGKTRPERFDVIFNAHVDCVAGSPQQFTPYIQGDNLYGRGIYDMKMASVIMADVFTKYVHTPGLTIGLQIVSDEEIGGFDGTKLHIDNGIAADFAVFGEMTDLGICNETRGICWIEVGFKGISAHGGYAWDGKNAITQASDFARAIVNKFPLPDQKAWTTTANIAAIATDNTTFNRVPDGAVVKIDFRFTPEDPHFTSEQSVREFIKELAPEAEVLSIPVFDYAVEVDPANKYLLEFMRAYTQATGDTPNLIKRYASSDTRHYARVGTGCIEFGLGGKNLHAENEYVDLTTVEPFTKTLVQFLENLAQRKSSARATQKLVENNVVAL